MIALSGGSIETYPQTHLSWYKERGLTREIIEKHYELLEKLLDKNPLVKEFDGEDIRNNIEKLMQLAEAEE